MKIFPRQRTVDRECPTHLSTFGPDCTKCESEAARKETIREQLLSGELSIGESVDLVPEWAPFADLVRDLTGADDADEFGYAATDQDTDTATEADDDGW